MTDFYADSDNYEGQPLRGETLDEKMDIEVRHGFIRKVFAILSVQLVVTTLIAAPFVAYAPAAHEFIASNPALLYIAIFGPLALICITMCSPQLMRSYPSNYVLLAAFTLCFGLIVGFTAAQYTAASVLMAAGMTAALCIGLMLYACQTKHDFTGFGPYLYCALLVMCLTSFILLFVPYSRPVEIVYCGIGVCLFSFYLVYDTQVIVAGKHAQFRLSVDDYAAASLALYLDIIQLFLYILRLLGDRR